MIEINSILKKVIQKKIDKSYITGNGTGIPGLTSPFYTVTEYSDGSTVTKGPFYSMKDAEKEIR